MSKPANGWANPLSMEGDSKTSRRYNKKIYNLTLLTLITLQFIDKKYNT